MPDGTPSREEFAAAASRVAAQFAGKPAPSREDFYRYVKREIDHGTVAANEPDTFIGGALQGFHQSVSERLPKYGRGLAEGAVSMLNPANLVMGPYQFAKDLITEGGGQTQQAINEMLHGNPEVIGQLTGSMLMGAAIPHALPKVPKAMMTAGDLMERGGKALRMQSGNLGAADLLIRHNPWEAAGALASPLLIEGAGKGIGKIGSILDDVRQRIAPEGPTQTPDAMSPRLVKKSGSTLEDALQRATDDVGRQSDTPEVNTLRPEQGMTDGASLHQSGKFGRSQSLGQPGGYSSGKPAVGPEWEANPYGADLADLPESVVTTAAEVGGRPPATASDPVLSTETLAADVPGSEAFRSMEDPGWHSGADVSTSRGREAQSRHMYEAEMDAGYKRRLSDERGEVPLDLLLKMLQGQEMMGVIPESLRKDIESPRR